MSEPRHSATYAPECCVRDALALVHEALGVSAARHAALILEDHDGWGDMGPRLQPETSTWAEDIAMACVGCIASSIYEMADDAGRDGGPQILDTGYGAADVWLEHARSRLAEVSRGPTV